MEGIPCVDRVYRRTIRPLPDTRVLNLQLSGNAGTEATARESSLYASPNLLQRGVDGGDEAGHSALGG